MLSAELLLIVTYLTEEQAIESIEIAIKKMSRIISFVSIIPSMCERNRYSPKHEY